MSDQPWAQVDLERLRRARRLCLFAHYHQDAVVAEHVLRYLQALGAAGFTVLVLSTSPLPDAECAKLRAVGAEVALRENRGMDFGGWIEACLELFPIEAELLLLANDSVYAPLGDLPAFVETLVDTEADFYGALESLEVAPHLPEPGSCCCALPPTPRTRLPRSCAHRCPRWAASLRWYCGTRSA
ncbi:hypothetical protein QP162_20785 [Sphingomonas aurantiaca]|uniref:hypothetical protein n=1 Tax=Sphingomonas aurantiaca TaxID=185949 RepID=UPI002FE26A6E